MKSKKAYMEDFLKTGEAHWAEHQKNLKYSYNDKVSFADIAKRFEQMNEKKKFFHAYHFIFSEWIDDKREPDSEFYFPHYRFNFSITNYTNLFWLVRCHFTTFMSSEPPKSCMLVRAKIERNGVPLKRHFVITGDWHKNAGIGGWDEIRKLTKDEFEDLIAYRIEREYGHEGKTVVKDAFCKRMTIDDFMRLLDIITSKDTYKGMKPLEVYSEQPFDDLYTYMAVEEIDLMPFKRRKKH